MDLNDRLRALKKRQVEGTSEKSGFSRPSLILTPTNWPTFIGKSTKKESMTKSTNIVLLAVSLSALFILRPNS